MKLDAAITGIGLVTPAGCDGNALWQAVDEERDCSSPITSGDGAFALKRAGIINDFKLSNFVGKSPYFRLMSREAMLACAAARLAIASAGLEGENMQETAIYAGTGATGLDFKHIERMLEASRGGNGKFDLQCFSEKGLNQINPLLSFKILPNMPVCFVAILNNIMGENLILNPWEGNTSQAILEAAWSVSGSRDRIVLCGGSDTKVHSQAFLFLEQLGLLIPDAEPGQTSFIPGEASSYLVFEAKERAGKRTRARLTAAMTTSDFSCGWTYSNSEKIYCELLFSLLEEAGIKSEEINALLLSSNGDNRLGYFERDAINRVFPQKPPAYAISETITETFAAASPMKIAAAVSRIESAAWKKVLVTSFGNGPMKAAFILEAA
ncbi:beta-ketoacyl synthase N-terminal-like domain-containing protein [Candidatus Riflebacteria bacterium]